MTSFSSWGPTDDGRIKPDIVAPGCESGGEGYIHSTLPGNVYGGPGWCGTSMAAPVVSGISGLIIEQYRLIQGGSNPLPSTVRALFIQTAVDLDDGSSYYNPGPDYASGYGRVDAQAAVDEVIAKRVLEDQVSHGQMDTLTVTVPAGSPVLKLTLAWDDEPGAVNASPALVNDLDMILVEPDGSTTHLPWILDSSNPSTPAMAGSDSINNVEQVLVANPTPGLWQVQVVGTNVPVGPQLYSLVGAASSTVISSPVKVSLQKSAAPLEVASYQSVTYTLERSFTLLGQHSYREIVHDPIPEGTTLLPGSVTLNSQPAPHLYNAASNAIYYEHIGTFTNTEQWTISFQVQVADVPIGRSIINTVTDTASFDGGAFTGPYTSTEVLTVSRYLMFFPLAAKE
jgi:hypothetical protein